MFRSISPGAQGSRVLEGGGGKLAGDSMTACDLKGVNLDAVDQNIFNSLIFRKCEGSENGMRWSSIICRYQEAQKGPVSIASSALTVQPLCDHETSWSWLFRILWSIYGARLLAQIQWYIAEKQDFHAFSEVTCTVDHKCIVNWSFRRNFPYVCHHNPSL